MSDWKECLLLLTIIFCTIICAPGDACIKIYTPDLPPTIELLQNGNERGYDLHETRDGGFIFTGTVQIDSDNSDGTSGSSGILVRKMDTNHTVIWERAIGGSGQAEGRKIRETDDGGYLVVGMTISHDADLEDQNHGGWDIVVSKLAGTGTPEWIRTYGGSRDDFGENLRLTTNGAIIIGRTFSHDGDVSGRENYTLAQKEGAAEIPERSNNLPGSFTKNESDTGLVAYLVDDTIRDNEPEQSDVWIVGIDDQGNILWQQRYGGSRDDYGYDILPQEDGGLLFVGITRSNDGDTLGKNFGEYSGTSDGWFVRLKPDHTIDWQDCLGGTLNEGLFSIEPAQSTSIDSGCCGEKPLIGDQKNGYILAGYAESNDGDVFPRPMKNHESYDGWLVQINADFSKEWSRCIGGSKFDAITSSQQTNNAKYIFSGLTRSSDGDILTPTGEMYNPGRSGFTRMWPADELRSVPQGSGPGPVIGLYFRYDDTVDWLKYLGANETGVLNSVEITPDGRYITAGWIGSAGNQTVDIPKRGRTNSLVAGLSGPIVQSTIQSIPPTQKAGVSVTFTPESVRKSVTVKNSKANVTQASTISSPAPSRTEKSPTPVLIPIAAACCAALVFWIVRFPKK